MEDRMDTVEMLLDWFLNVWDELGEETTREDILNDFEGMLGNRDLAEKIVEAWFADHGKLLKAWTSAPHPALSVMAYEEAVREWIEKKLLDFTA
jgi:hypothetical protein